MRTSRPRSRCATRCARGWPALVDVAPENVALATSTTNGCNIVLAGLGLGPEDEVVTTDGEHFGLLGALAVSQARLRIARVRELPPDQALDALLAGGDAADAAARALARLLDDRQPLPVAELKEATGLPLLVDGAQSVGAIPVDASQVDYYAFSGQKWLCGPDSTGGLYVADPESLRLAAPSYFSQAELRRRGRFTPRPGAAPLRPRLDAAGSARRACARRSTLQPDWRFERAAADCRRCRDLLAERFEVVTAASRATLVTFRVDEDAAALVRRLYDEGVVVRDIPGQGWLRVSCGWWTSDEDLERLLAGSRGPFVGPARGAIGRIASITKAMCSSSSTPSTSAPS